ncbi:tRNA pseudouridine(13) synthase TruD [Methanoregula sp.]|uniref:tRNA pseudouridine(13) synthase TruD n=1 Tax=Methanoregula sp. TaxID=2052170 RepID=UPI002CA5321D|nr:tRNA pseudouridine(13) synthase TruD [Methanoregula sp.]HVP97434.1 tRNA pseudouridine(13) synthase TruD [Methanoregula sp.]
MRESPYPLERELGMQFYATDTAGIGGTLRTVPDDFIVEEIPLDKKGGSSGPYLICRLTKTNWELQHAVKEIAKRLNISHRRIGWGGTKDRNARTTQLLSLYKITPEQVAALHIKDITLEVIGEANEQLSLGDLAGNRFDILIRDVDTTDPASQVSAVTDAAAVALPNYFGLQRFGVIRPLTHRIGELILRGEYEQAVASYVGQAFPLEREEARRARTLYWETRDPALALRELPVPMSFERSMLSHLQAHPGDYSGALRQLPPKLLSMFVSAFQSYLFNCALSHRLATGHALAEAVPGDRLIFANGRTDTATAASRAAVSIHLSRGRCSIGLFMPGRDDTGAQAGDESTRAMLADLGITADHFRRASEFVQTKFDGAWRPIALHTAIEAAVQDTGVRLKFTLPPGHYATTVCREYMKADPVRMV